MGGLPVETPTEYYSTLHNTLWNRLSCGGGEGTSGQRSHSRSPKPTGRVLLKYILSPNEGQRSETNDKPEGSEQFIGID